MADKQCDIMATEDLLAAKAEAKDAVVAVSDGALQAVSGDWGAEFYYCKKCGNEVTGSNGICGYCDIFGDARTDVDEALADADALMADVDSFDC